MISEIKRSSSLENSCFIDGPIESLETRWELISGFWPPKDPASGEDYDLDDFTAYFRFFRQECDPMRQSMHAVHNYDHLLLIHSVIRRNPTATISQLKEIFVQEGLPKDENTKISASIELVVRLWLMINVRNTMPNNPFTMQTVLAWPDDISLSEVIRRWISYSQMQFRQSVSDPVRQSSLNVYDMVQISGLRIVWTDDLASHLLLLGTELHLYSHVTILERLRDSLHSPLPRDFIEETLSTLSLVLPLTDRKCTNWLSVEVNSRGLDRNILYRNNVSQSIADYPYWQSRLLTLADWYDRSRPATLRQWWLDRRDTTQWWGFWLVVVGIFLTAIFGLIQSVTGIIEATRPTAG